MKSAREKADEWVSENVVAADSCDYLDLIKSLELLLKHQDRGTRHACAEAVLQHGDAPAIEMIDRCHNACMNVKAV